MDEKPFDAQDELRHHGRSDALKLLLSYAGKADAATPKLLAEAGLRRIEYQVAIEQNVAECPEAWLEGMHDIERALREAIGLPG